MIIDRAGQTSGDDKRPGEKKLRKNKKIVSRLKLKAPRRAVLGAANEFHERIKRRIGLLEGRPTKILPGTTAGFLSGTSLVGLGKNYRLADNLFSMVAAKVAEWREPEVATIKVQTYPHSGPVVKTLRSVTGDSLGWPVYDQISTLSGGDSAFSHMAWMPVLGLPVEAETNDQKTANVAAGQVAADKLLDTLITPGLPLTCDPAVPSYRANPENPSQIIRTVGDVSEIGVVIGGKFRPI